MAGALLLLLVSSSLRPALTSATSLSDYSWQHQQPITACYVSPYWVFCLLSHLTLTAQATAVWWHVPPSDCRSAVQRPPQPITACFVQSPVSIAPSLGYMFCRAEFVQTESTWILSSHVLSSSFISQEESVNW